jgi:hypothetical protein
MNVIALDNCIHPTIVSWESPMLFELVFQCEVCCKKVAIPMLTRAEHTEEDMHNILFMTFGRSIDIMHKGLN